MSAQPWFLAGSNSADNAAPVQRLRIADIAIPSATLKLFRPWADVSLAEFAVPSGRATLELVGAFDASAPGLAELAETISSDSLAMSFEDRVNIELPRAELIAGRRHPVGAVVLGLTDGHIDDWIVVDTVGESLSGASLLWACDAGALEAYEALAESTDADGHSLGFFVARTAHDQDGISLLTHPTWPAPILTLARSGHEPNVDGRARLWEGRDADGRIVGLAIDLAHAVIPSEVPSVDDPWVVPVSGGARLHPDADMASLLKRVRPFWVAPYFAGPTFRVGRADAEQYERLDEDGGEIFYYPDDITIELVASVPLEGHLIVGDPEAADKEGAPTGVVVDAGVYPVFRSVDADMGSTALMIRLGSSTPARWSYAPGLVGDDTPYGSGNAGLWGDSADRSLFGIRPSRHHPVFWSGQGSGVLNCESPGNDGVMEVYVAYDDSDLPVAIVLDMFNMVSSDYTTFE